MKSIKISIAGRPYPLKVTEEEEQHVLRVVEEINEKLTELKSMYRSQEQQDYLAMTLLTYALERDKAMLNDDMLSELGSKADNILALLEDAS